MKNKKIKQNLQNDNLNKRDIHWNSIYWVVI